MEQDSEEKLSPDRAIKRLKEEAGKIELLDEKDNKIKDKDGNVMTYGDLMTNTDFLKVIVKVILDEVKMGKFSININPIIVTKPTTATTVTNADGLEVIGEISGPIEVVDIEKDSIEVNSIS